MFNVVILISGNGSNLQAIIDATKKDLPIHIAAVISNDAKAYGLKRAAAANIPTHVIDHHEFDSRDAFDAVLQRQIDHYQPDAIALAGFMRRLGPDFVAHYAGRLINIHPALLPKYPGLNTHHRVLEAGETEHGASIHYVADEVDAGPIICQAALAVRADDTEESLKVRVQALEHQIYPMALDWMAQGRLALVNQAVWLDGKPLDRTGKRLNLM